MKLTCICQEVGQVDTLLRIVSAVSKLSKKCVIRVLDAHTLHFIVRHDTDAAASQLFCVVRTDRLFSTFRVEGLRPPDANEVVLDLPSANLLHAVRSIHRHTGMVAFTTGHALRIRLTKRDGQPYLTLDTRCGGADGNSLLHNIPVNIIAERYWSDYDMPARPIVDVEFVCPSSFLKQVTGFRVLAQHAVLSASNDGVLVLSGSSDAVEIKAHFRDIEVTARHDQNTDPSHLYTVRVDTRSLVVAIPALSQLPGNVCVGIQAKRKLCLSVSSGSLDLFYYLPAVSL